MSNVASASLTKCKCVPDGRAFACVCPCGMQMRADVPHVFHACGMDPQPVAQQMAALPPPGGPGTELKKLLRLVGITAKPNCPCNAHAVQMDIWGADECQQRLDEIVGWLREEAGRRHLPFSETIARQVVLLAIRRARKTAAH